MLKHCYVPAKAGFLLSQERSGVKDGSGEEVKMKNIKSLMPYWAEDGSAGGAPAPDPVPAEPGKSDEGQSDDSNDGGKAPGSLDEMLKANPSFQSELDRRINKAVETATANERDRQQIIQDSLQDEVLRVSKMTQAEKDAYFKKKSEDESKAREADLIKRELTLDAKQVLQEKGLPLDFVDLLNYQNKEACSKSIDILAGAFEVAVQKAVEEKLKGSAPPADAGTEGDPGSAPTDFERIKAEAMKIAGLKTK